MPDRPRTVVTGGGGFLGSHLCDRLIAEGHEVVCIDNFVTGRPENIAHLIGSPAFSVIRHDVSTFVFVAGPVDNILHFASPASPADYLKLPIQTLKVGALGTHNLLGLAKVKEARFLLASTSEVYGDPLEHPQSETYRGNVDPVGGRGVYDEAKRFAEAMTMAYHRYHGVETRIARIFNTYGPRMRMDDGRVLPTFMAQALDGLPLTVFGDGSQTRSFCYIDDMIDGILGLLASDTSEPVNLGNPEEVSIRELADEIIRLTRSSSGVEFRELPDGDPKVRRPDIARAQRLFGWSPSVSRAEGLERTLEFHKAEYDLVNESDGNT